MFPTRIPCKNPKESSSPPWLRLGYPSSRGIAQRRAVALIRRASGAETAGLAARRCATKRSLGTA